MTQIKSMEIRTLVFIMFTIRNMNLATIHHCVTTYCILYFLPKYQMINVPRLKRKPKVVKS